MIDTGSGYFLQFNFNSAQLAASGGIRAIHRLCRQRGLQRNKRLPLRLQNGKWMALYEPKAA